MKFKRYLSIFVVFLMCFSLLMAGCSQSEPIAQEITISLEGEPDILDPQLVVDVLPMKVINAIFEGLCRKDKDGIPSPGAAKSWDISKDKLVYTFYLRDANWPDGSEVTANDFRDAWLRALDPEPVNHNPALLGYLLLCIKGADKYFAGEGSKEDVAVKVKDKKTLVVTLNQPTPYFLDLVCSSVFMPVNMKFFENQPVESNVSKYGAEAQNIMGNGPFVIKEWNHGQNIVLERNEKYWNVQNIKLDNAVFKIIPDNSSAVTSFKAGEIDVVDITEPHQVEELKRNGGRIETYSVGATQFISVNNEHSVLKNVNLREALAFAIGRETLIEKVLGDDSEKALGFVNPVVRGVDKTFRDEVGDHFKDNNVAEAKRLVVKALEELGMSSLPKLSMLIDDMETSKRDAQAIQDMWRQNIGLEVEIVTMPFEAIQDKMLNKDYQMSLLMWSGDYNDPNSFLEIFESSNYFNVVGYNNAAYDQLISQAREEEDENKRMDMFRQAEKMLFDDMPVCPLYYITKRYAYKSKVKDLVRGNSTIQDIDLYWTYIEK